MNRRGVNAVRGLSPRAASPSTPSCETNGLPSAKDKVQERFLAPDPNPESLKTILRENGFYDQFIAPIADGFVPREFRPVLTQAWKTRDAFYEMASFAVQTFMGKNSLSFAQVPHMIVETINDYSPFIHDLADTAAAIHWIPISCPFGTFAWPSSIPPCSMQKELLTAIRLYVLYTIWSMHPAILLPVDFSWGLVSFSNEDYIRIKKLVIDAHNRHFIKLSSIRQKTFSTASVLDANVQLLVDTLRYGPMSTGALMSELGVKRGLLRKRFLIPAEKAGVIEKTERGSSPKQCYRLVPAVCQVPDLGVTGSSKPVPFELEQPGKQALSTGKTDSMAITVLRVREDTPVRLARYNRWFELEKAIIHIFRVERFLRSKVGSGEYKELGIIDKLSGKKEDLYSFYDCLFNPKYWGFGGGLLLADMQRDAKGNFCSFSLGESNLLNLISQIPGFDLAACSPTEFNENGKYEGIIPSRVLSLARYYGQSFDISDALDKPYHGGDKTILPTAVDLFNLYHPDMSKIVFHGKGMAQQFRLARLEVAGRTLLLPVRYYASAITPTLPCMMPEVPDTPVLYNADAIVANPGADVIISDEMGIPLINDDNFDNICGSWYGGMEVLDKLVLELPPGHQYRWLCFDNGNDPAEKYENAMRVNAIFQKHGLRIKFQVFDGVAWARNPFGMDTGIYESSRVLSFNDLKAEAVKYGVGIHEPNTDASADLRVHSMADLMALKPKDFTLYPLLKEGFYCLIFGGTGVAKTWFALHLAIALSQGETPFDKCEFRGKAPLNVLYVAGEMKPEEYGSRLRTLLADQKTNARFCLVREDLDLTTPEDQERVIKAVKNQKSQVVVLDNLSTLATNGHTEGQFEKVLSLIRELQATGIIVILVHHENREGNFKGSGRISLVADISLHLFHAGDGKKIELLVQPDKARSVSSAEFPPFHTEFDPENPTVVWLSRPLTPEERCRLDIDDPLGEVEQNIGKKRKNNQLAWEYQDEDGRGKAIVEGMLNGCHDDVIAADLAVRESVIADFKQEHGISSDTLTKCLPEAMSSQEISPEKMVPDKMAPIIWNILKNNKK